jgi:hypothetical protein
MGIPTPTFQGSHSPAQEYLGTNPEKSIIFIIITLLSGPG